MKRFRNLIVVGALAVNMLGFAAIAHAQEATVVPETTPEASVEEAVETPYLGVMFEGADGGISVVEVVPDSPADLAGVLAGDLITAINETPVTEDSIRETVLGFAVGDTITVSVTRGEESLSLDTTLAAAPVEAQPERRIRPGIEILPASRPLLGITIEDSDNGVRVAAVNEGSPAEAAGILADDIVTAIGGTPVATAEETVQAVTEAGDAAEIGEFDLTVSVTRGEESLELTATLTKTDAPVMPDLPGMRDRGGRGDRGFGFGFGMPGLQIVPSEGEEGAFDVVVPFTPADPAAVTPEVEAALAEIGIIIAPVEGEEGAFTLTLPAESLGNGGLMLPQGMEFNFSGPMGRGFEFAAPDAPASDDPAL